MEKSAIKKQLQKNKNELEDKVSQRHKMKEKSKDMIKPEKMEVHQSKREDNS